MDLKEIENKAKTGLEAIKNTAEFAALKKQFLGKRGEVVHVFDYLKTLPLEQKKDFGRKANILKQAIEKLFAEKEMTLKEAGQAPLEATGQALPSTGQGSGKKEFFDETEPGITPETGFLHLITQVQRQAESIFRGMGFELALGPEVETEWYNFDALNVAKDHPARDMQDTFWLCQKTAANKRFLPRTHTSSVQIRYMQSHKPPLRIIAPGRVFRNENTDVSHEAQFYQIEGLMVDKQVSASNFKAIIEEFLSRFFGKKTEIRLRPGYFPFVEPGFEIDAKMPGGKWLELMGAGMVHPNVFKAVGIKGFSGFAFGCGLERLIMIKYNISDLRLFYQNDLRFIKQF